MVRNHRKPLKAMVATSKNYRKTIDGNGQTAQKHSMVMVSSKTIENLQWSLQNHWNLQWIPKKHWTCKWSSQINILLKQLNYPVVTFTILIWLCCSKVYCQSSLIFIAAHCSYKPNQNHCWPLPSKFWKPSKNHWFQWLDPPKNIQWWWSNFVKTIEKPLTAMVA